MDGREWYDDDGWHYEAPRLDARADRLTLALLGDLSNLLVVHGYAATPRRPRTTLPRTRARAPGQL